MVAQRDVAVVTYNGVDGACAAAAVLLKYPGADLWISSAARIGRTLADLDGRQARPSEVHVCGLGVRCEWDDVARPARSMQNKDTRLTWYCGRGYLEGQRGAFAQICTPAFGDHGSNTQAVCEHLGLPGDAGAQALLELARCDPNIGGDWPEPAEEQAFWIDLIDASVAEYFKYQDEQAYKNTIRKLARMEYAASDRRAVEVFRRAGFKHVLWGKSDLMRALRGRIRKCAEADEAVLITGESGVGKEYVAHLLHERSSRATGPFIPINCALFAGNVGMANSVLFGHVQGAFTGAVKDRDGAFVSADSGILFLDEIGELPLEVQPKFLRVLEDGWASPVGLDRPVRVDVRVVAATSRDLPAMIRGGDFRADLYHRLDILQVRVASLREHTQDIAAIVGAVLPSLAQNACEAALGEADLAALCGYDWPGNVRQLIKLLKRSLLLDAPIPQLIEEERRLGGLTAADGEAGEVAGLLPATLEDIRPLRAVRREYAARALELHDGNWKATARALRIAVNTLRAYLTGSG